MLGCSRRGDNGTLNMPISHDPPLSLLLRLNIQQFCSSKPYRLEESLMQATSFSEAELDFADIFDM